MIFGVVLAVGVIGLSSCGRNSQAEEDEANLKLVGYDMDQVGFFKAAGNDDLQALKIFKERGFDFNQRDIKGRTAVYVAAEEGAVRAISFLAKHGADIEAADQSGVTPLMAAARAGNTGTGDSSEVIKYLLDKGADARRKDKVGKFALIHAMDGKSSEAIHLLAPETRKLLDTGILYAADMNHHETIPILVKYGASVYARNSGKTSLMIAAERGHEKAASVLIKEGANLYAVSDDGKLAKDYAGGNERVLAVLLEEETDIETEPLALEWSEEELEQLVQKAMDRSNVHAENVVKLDTDHTPKQKVTAQTIKGKNLQLELADSAAVNEQVMMAAYAEKSLPIQARADDSGKVEIYDLRRKKAVSSEVAVANELTGLTVVEGTQIGMTGLRVKQIKKKMVSNKLTNGQERELVTLMIEDEKTGQLREIYAGYESQAAEAVAVLRINETGELLIVERGDEFFDLKGTAYKVMDVNDEEVIVENMSSRELTMLPLMGIKR